jgi:imidazolonepropionase-like amidohydrolase
MPSLVPRGLIFTGDTFIEAGCVLVEQSKSVIVEEGRKSEPEGARILDVQGSTIQVRTHIHCNRSFGSSRHHAKQLLAIGPDNPTTKTNRNHKTVNPKT